MVSNKLNFLFLIIIITIFLFFLCSNDIHGFRTPSQKQERVFTPNGPIYLTPSNIKIIKSEDVILIDNQDKNGFFVGRISPTGSLTTSTIDTIPTAFPKKPILSSISETNIVTKNNRKESVGERLCHKIFHEFVASKLGKEKEIMRNIRPNFLKNPKTKCNLELDMFEAFDVNIKDKNSIKDGIAIEYNGLQHDQFIPGMHYDEKDFNEQKFRDEFKAKICKEKGIFLIIVDTKIDISRVLNNKGRKKFIYFTESEREANIRDFLIPKLENAYQQLIQQRKYHPI